MNNDTSAKKAKKPNIFFRLLALIVTAALVLGALALVVYRDRFNVDAVKRWLAYRTMETSESGEAAPFTHAGGDNMSIAYLDSGIVTVSTAGAHYYSLSGDLYAEEVLPLDNPVLTHTRSAAVAYDAGGQSLFLFRRGEEAFQLTLEGDADLLSARPNDSGWLAVTAQQSGYKGAVTVYDAAQQPVIQISLSSTFVVDAALSPDCKTVAVITMGQEGGSFYSHLLLYPVDQTEPTAQLDLGNTVVLDLEYEQDSIWILGEDCIVVADAAASASQSYSFGRGYLKGCDFGGDGFALLLTGRYRAGSATQALIIDSSGQAVSTLALSGQILDYAAAGSYCALLSGGQLDIYDQNLQSYAVLEELQGAKQTDLSPDGSALLADGQQAWLFIPG